MLQFNVTFGVMPGYNHRNEPGEVPALTMVQAAWTVAMEAERERTGLTVAAVLLPSTTVYPMEYGCPMGGEATVTALGTMHPRTTGTPAEWKAAVQRVVEGTRNGLSQSTAMIAFSTAEVHYLLGEKRNG